MAIRRAKFRSDLISDTKATNEIRRHRHHRHHHHPHGLYAETNGNTTEKRDNEESAAKAQKLDRFRRPSQARLHAQAAKQFSERLSVQDEGYLGTRPTRRAKQRMRSLSPGGDQSRDDSASRHTASSFVSVPPTPREDEYELDEAEDQDIEELWYDFAPAPIFQRVPEGASLIKHRFPGCHADLGGGWPLADGEESALSHAPLVWVRRLLRATFPKASWFTSCEIHSKSIRRSLSPRKFETRLVILYVDSRRGNADSPCH